MARLPTRDDLGPLPSARSGRVVSAPDLTAVGRGLASMGASIADAGQSIGGAISERETNVDQATRFETQRRFLEFTAQQEDALTQSGQSAQPGAFGFREGFQESYKKAAKEFFSTIPDALKPEYDVKLFQGEDSLAGKALVFERTQRKDYYTNTVNDGLTKIENKLYENPEAFDTNLKEGDDYINSIPDEDVSPIEKEDMRRQWKRKAQAASLGGMPPQARMEALGGVPVDASLPDAIKGAAAELGVSPNDIATAISYETGGTFDPWKAGPTTKWGQHRGLIQWGEPQRQKYGVTKGMPVAGQMKAVVAYLKDAGVKPGMGLLDIYSAINAGRVGLYDRSDHKAGGAPGTVADKVTHQMEGHKAKAAALLGGTFKPEIDPRFADIPWDDREKIIGSAQTEQNKLDAEARVAAQFSIEDALTNAPVAIQNTGEYDGAMPTQDQFIAAYGERAIEKFKEFEQAIETSQQAYRMQTMPEDEIAALVKSAEPTSSGDNAALEQERYEVLSKAAETTLKARETDPAQYVRKVFPSVDEAWKGVRDDYSGAVAVSIAAQEQLGIKDIKPLPSDATDYVVEQVKDVNKGEAERFSAAATALFSTSDPSQRRAIFEQLVDAGMPDITEGAFAALERGDRGAAQRLFQAAIINPADLPGQADHKPAEIDEAIQSQLMAEGELGNVYYGLTDGTAENFIRAQRDSKLITNAVHVRLRNGEDLEDAVNAVAKDLYGDLQVISGDGRIGAQILAPMDADPNAISDGLATLIPNVRAVVEKSVAVPKDAPKKDGTKAILDAATSNYIDNVMAEGFFRNADDGYVFIDPYVGAAITDETGKPVIFKAPVISRPKDAGDFSSRIIDENAARQGAFQ